MTRLVPHIVVIASLLGCAFTAPKSSPGAEQGALADVVADTCDAHIVFLGEEAHHGGGKTIQVKTQIVRDLVQKCGFTHIAFESQIYDFVDLQERYAAGTATKPALYDAIGGLWSRTAEIDPLVDLLHEGALTGKLRISGFDGQIGGAMGYYTQTQLPQRLASVLSEPRRELCATDIGRLTGWRFDKAHPKDARFDEAVLGCAKEIEGIAESHVDRDPIQYRFARSFRTYLEFSTSETESRNDRDRLMYENFEWMMARHPRGTKTIVWTATIHSLRQPLNEWEGMASHAVRGMKPRIKSVAIVATSGSYARPDGVLTDILPADAESLEGHSSPAQGAESRYIHGADLKKTGARTSRLVSYDKYLDEEWGRFLDGVVVLVSEVPPTYVRPPKPMQAP